MIDFSAAFAQTPCGFTEGEMATRIEARFAALKAEGRKAFEALVSQGVEMQAQSQEMATRQWAEAAERLGAMTQQVAGGAPTWNRLGSIFESRVQRALNNLGLPTAEQWAALNARVERLEQALDAAGVEAKDKGPTTAAAKKKSRPAKS